MIIMRMMGGLGNQMFQYALGRSLALRHNVVFKMDLAPLQADPLRSYSLSCFHIDTPPALPGEVAHLRGLEGGRLSVQVNRLCEILRPFAQRHEVFERTWGFDPAVLQIQHDAYLIGYWQDERYFQDIEQELRQDFVFKEMPDTANAEILEQIYATQSVSLHIRRADYVTNAKVATTLQLCDLDYYRNATDLMQNKVPRAHFFVFSDDLEWAQSNIRINSPITFVSHNRKNHDHEDMRLMATCKHNIIANSSFSWWGAWLGNHPEKVVIAPQNWYTDQRANATKQLPAQWIRL